jgi:hypothetical protein
MPVLRFLLCLHMPTPAEPEYDPAGQAVQEEPPAVEPSKGRNKAEMQQWADWRREWMKCVSCEFSNCEADRWMKCVSCEISKCDADSA